MLAETGNSFYDLLLILNNGGTDTPVKVRVRTLSNNFSFSVNSGGGVNRPRPLESGVQIPSLNDVQLWIGVTNDFDLYYFPHQLIFGRTRPHHGLYKPIGSLSKTKINHTKNNTANLDNFFNHSLLTANVLHPISDYSSWR